VAVVTTPAIHLVLLQIADAAAVLQVLLLTCVPLCVALLRQVVDRLQHFAPMVSSEDELPSRPIHQQALELAEAAASPKTLCRMDPTWHPWF